MKILHVYKDYMPVVGGIENLVRMLAEAQAHRGHEVTVLVTSQSRHTERETIAGVQVIRAARLASLSSAPLSVSLVTTMRGLRPHVTHLHAPYPVGEAAWLVAGTSPMVISYQSDIVRQRVMGAMWSPFLRRLLRRADLVMASNPAYVETSPFLRDVRERVRIVPNGIDVSRFEGIDRDAARRRYGSEPSVVFVGRLRYYKGLNVLVDALAQLPGVRLLLVGTGPEGQRLHSQADAAGVADQIDWMGDVPDDELPMVLAAADLFVLPSTARSEAFGVAMVEAMASGLPCVSTELGTGTSWVNLDGVTGSVVPAGQPSALAQAIKQLLADEPRRARLGQAAKDRAHSRFQDHTMVNNVAAIYEEVLP